MNDECRIEVEVERNRTSMTYGTRINGVLLPNVTKVTATYGVGDARRVTIEFVPTDFIEIERGESERATSTGDTVAGA